MDNNMLRFMRMVAPVSAETWITIHHKFLPAGATKAVMPGSSHRNITTAMNDATYWATKGASDVYISQAAYKAPGIAKEGSKAIYPPALRDYNNIAVCKNLYIDCDVKEDGYHTVEEMKLAVKGFLERAKLPMPNVIVGSGNGGWHIYWCMDTAFELKEYRRLAGQLVSAANEYGLLFDQACTTDATRLLRVVGTWNFKYATPEGVEPIVDAKPVTLDYCTDGVFVNLNHMTKALDRWPVAVVTQGVNRPAVIGATHHGLSVDEGHAELTGGVKKDYAPISIDEVAKHCPFVANTLGSGGANLVGDPQWHAVVAIACHTTEPRETAHRLCEKSPYYTVEGTDQKLETAQLARANRATIGPPKCAHIALERDECKSCPHLALQTSPVSVGFKIPNGHKFAFSPAAIPAGVQPIELPWPYYYDQNFLVYKKMPDDGTPNEGDGLVFEYPIFNAMLEKGSPSFKITFDTVQGEKVVNKKFDTSFVSDNTSFAKAMAAEGLTVNIRPEKPRAFVSSYISKLQEKRETLIDIPAFGWSQDQNGEWGFAYAGEFVSPAGVQRCCNPPDGVANYAVMGDDTVWQDLMKLIITPDRPDLACMVASSFASPLVGMTGENGLLMGVVSSASGIGKSTALIGGQTVWSSPRVGGLNDTVIFTFNKAATLRHLPIFYDEIKGDKQLKNMTEIAFQLTGGKEKGRSDRSGKMREVKEFRTLCGYAANASIVAGVREEDKGTDASWLRMFEMKGIRLPENNPNFASNVQNLLTGLALNHGGIGKRYANLLGKNYKLIYTQLETLKQQFGQALGASPKVERFWVAAIATTIAGARLANILGVVNFPLLEMQQFMFAEFQRMKTEMDEDPSDYSKDIAFKATLGAFLNEKQPRNMILLDKTWAQPRRPPKGFANVLNDRADSAWGKLEVQISGDPLQLRIADAALTEWCARTNRPKNIFVEQLRTKLKARLAVVAIGSGSRKGGTSENAWVIQVPGTIIEDDMEYTINHKMLP